MEALNFSEVPTPSYVVDERLLKKNLKVLQMVKEQTGCKILLAQKAFSMFALYPMIRRFLDGTTASSLYEARLGQEMFGGETHIFEPAYRKEELQELLPICDHIVFNSPEQWLRYRQTVIQERGEQTGCGIRVNPEYAEVEQEIYNPCCDGSRLGITRNELELALQKNPDMLDGIEGIHFHVMCEQNADTLQRVLQHVEERFGAYMALPQIKWVNFGGGHHITRPDYELSLLIHCICHIQATYHVQVYLEPGEAVALNTGYLVSTVMDVRSAVFEKEGIQIQPAILDASAACHMPDVLEMPYRPEIIGAGNPGQYPYTYRFGGNTCLAGDIIGDYSFQEELKPGDRVVFCDMAHYTMVKNNTFNGIGLPSIITYNEEEGFHVIRKFGYQDFKMRLS